MAKDFDKFSDLIQYKKTCPICSKDLKYLIKTTYFKADKTTSRAPFGSFMCKPAPGADKKFKQYKLMESFLNESNVDEVKVEFIPTQNKEIEVKEFNSILKLDENIGVFDDVDSACTSFSLKIYCDHGVLGNGYEALGSFDFDIDFADEHLIPKKDDKYCFEISNIRLDYELYKVCNIHLEDKEPNGNIIKIINDFHINKTSFSLAEVNLDGTLGVWKEKRIDLVEDSFFKFCDTEKIYSRINTIFLLK
jgi:hypothetical protein